MGILRSIGKAVGGFFFTSFLTLLILDLILVEFTEYNNLKPVAVNLITKVIMSQINMTEFEEQFNITEIAQYCEKFNISEIPVPMEIAGQNITIKCPEIREAKLEDFIKSASSQVFDGLYYKKYECKFLDCLKSAKENKENLLVVLSTKANEFFKGILNYLYVGTAVSGIVLIVSSTGLTGILKNFGYSFIAVSIPFFLFPIVKNMLPIPAEALALVGPTIDQIFNKISDKFLPILIIGVVLTVLGYLIAYFQKKKTKK